MLYRLKYDNRDVLKKRRQVYEEFVSKSANIKSGVISKISVFDLRVLFKIYDQIFFNDYFAKEFPGSIDFSLSTRMTRSAGKTIYSRNIKRQALADIKIEIRMGMSFFFKYYETSRSKEVNGIETKDALEAFLLVFEHELCHLLELVSYRDSSCRDERFKIIANNIFGHRDVYHKLPTEREIAGAKYGIGIGTYVAFEFEDRKLQGFVHNINKRATVMAVDPKGSYADKSGMRYTKYYVPIEKLNIIEKK